MGLCAGMATAAETAEVRLTVQIAPPENHPPFACTTGPYSTGVSEPITVSGEPSYDPDPGDHIVLYEWDLDDDGAYELTGMEAAFVRDELGTYTIRLRVTDRDGETDETETTVAVLDLYMVDYTYTSRKMINRFVIEYGLAVKFQNDSNDPVFNVKLTLTGTPAAYSVVDGEALLGDVPAKTNTWSNDDDIIIRQDRRIPVQPNEQLLWTVEFDDVDGAHHVITEVTQTR